MKPVRTRGASSFASHREIRAVHAGLRSSYYRTSFASAQDPYSMVSVLGVSWVPAGAGEGWVDHRLITIHLRSGR